MSNTKQTAKADLGYAKISFDTNDEAWKEGRGFFDRTTKPHLIGKYDIDIQVQCDKDSPMMKKTQGWEYGCSARTWDSAMRKLEDAKKEALQSDLAFRIVEAKTGKILKVVAA